MDDGVRCQLVDVINDPHLLESFLENGAATSGESSNRKNKNNSHKQSASKQDKVTKSGKTQARVKVTSSPTEGKNSKKKSEARQVDTVTSSDGAASAEPTDQKKKSGSKSAGGQKSSTVPTSRVATGLMLPQQLQVQVSPGAQVVPGIAGPMLVARPSGQTAAPPLVHFIQTSNGQTAQYLPVSMQSGQTTVKSGSGQTTRAGNKQILPKPSSGPTVCQPMSSLTPNNMNHPVIRPALSVAGTPHAVTLAQNSMNSPQLILSGGQTPSLIQGPNGTFILNPAALQGMGGQQLFLQNNGLGAMGAPLQLTIRAPGPQVVVSSSPSFQSNAAPLLSQLSQQNRGVAGQPTFVLQQNSAQGQSIFAPRSSGQNMVWARNSAPMISSPAVIQNPAPQPQQYISIQTANGPMLLPIAMGQSGPQILPQSSQSISIPGNNSSLVQNFTQFSGTTLQSLLTTNTPANDLSHVSVSSASNNSIIITTSQSSSQSTATTPKTSHKKNSSTKSVNLADLLKESGILENSPPTSPTDTKSSPNTSATFSDTSSLVQHQQQQQQQQQQQVQQPQQTVFMVPAAANQPAQNLVLTPAGIQGPGMNQLRLSVTADGSMILQPSGPGVQTFSVQQPLQQFVESSTVAQKEVRKDAVLGASQPSPDSTTPTLDATPQSLVASDQPAASDPKAKVKPDEQKQAAMIPMTVTDINSTNESQKMSKLRDEASLEDESPATTSAAPADVIRVSNCDSRLQGTSTGAAAAPDPVTRKTDGPAGAVMQISLDDKAFMEGLETQIRGLTSIASLTEQQKVQLRELEDLQKQINEAKKNQSAMPGGESVKVLVGVPPIRVAAPEQQQAPLYHQVIQANTQNLSQRPNVQLVNLLKPQGAGLTVAPQTSIRLMGPTVNTCMSEAPTFQLMGNQLITITSPLKSQAIQTQMPAQPKMSVAGTPVIQVVRIQTTQASGAPIAVQPTASKANDPAQEQERRKQKTLKFFNQQLAADQSAALKPDYKTAFKNVDDACKRLVRYHVLQSTTCSTDVLTKIDGDFETISRDLLIKKQLLVDRFRRCLLRQSYSTEVSESVMLNKMFIADETSAMKFDKEVVAQGIPLDLPPAPRAWQNEIDARMHDEERELSRKRKLPFLDEDLSEHLSEVKKQPLESLVDKESEEGTEDEDEDSDDDDDDDANPGDDMSEYLGPNDNGNVDINSIYDDINCDPSLAVVDTRQDLTFCQRPDGLPFNPSPSPGQPVWRMGLDRNHWPPPPRFPEREAAVAVESILTSEEEEDEDEDEDEANGLPVDVSASMVDLECQIDNDQDVEEEDEDEDEEDDEDAEDEEDEEQSPANHAYHAFRGAQPQGPETPVVDSCDPQIQCAIDSILVDLPQEPTHQSFFHGDNYGRPYGSMSGNMSVVHRPGISSFGHSLQGQINDPALDEAVKSILS